MLINEVENKKNVAEQLPGLGQAVGDAVLGGIAKIMGTGQQDPNKVASANTAQIAQVAKRALPMWQAKQAQISSTVGTPNFDEELEAWLEDNILRNRLNIDDLDPTYQRNLKNQIKVVNSIADTDLAKKREEFARLIGMAVIARPSRQQVSQVRGRADVASAVNSVMALIAGNAQLNGSQLTAMGTGFRNLGINSIPRATINKLAGTSAQAVETLLLAMGIAVS